MTAAYPPRLQKLVDSLSLATDRSERIDALVQLARRFRSRSPEGEGTPYGEDHRVPGCESDAYVWATRDESARPKLWFAVNNPNGVSAMALAEILDEGLSGEDPATIASVPDDLVYDVFGVELSMGKTAGLLGMLRMTKALAARLV